MAMRIDKYYDKPIVWDKVFMDNNSEQFEHLSYETMRAVGSNVINDPMISKAIVIMVLKSEKKRVRNISIIITTNIN